ncbi:MAG: hypothetical protein J6X20_01835, partial [Bacteroidales bacterium]|nr:hypothetical protein [Bacteroidales bacterium]
GMGRGMMDPTAMIQMQVESLNTAVTLTEDQKKKATEIFTDAQKKQTELMQQLMPQGMGGPQGAPRPQAQ